MAKRPDSYAAHLPNALKASASSLGTLLRCERAWFAEKILQLDNPTTAKQEASFSRGSQLHEAIEGFLLDAAALAPDDALADLATPFLAKLRGSPGLAVEQEMSFELGGIVVRGFIDVYTDRGILDFKTTSSIYMWGEKAHTIGYNLQLMIYAHWWLIQHPDANELTIGHLQFQTKGKAEVRLVHVSVTREHVAEFVFSVLEPLLARQHVVASASGMDEVAPNYSSCGAYGGCPHRATCSKIDAARASVLASPDLLNTTSAS